MCRVRQAVILAGGRGTRLGEHTACVPKPMVPINGRPFIEYVVEMLRNEGIEQILFLLGYLPDSIIGHFGTGSAFGVQIDYSVSPVEDETGTRLDRARDRIDSTFLLTYCDNYWPLNLALLQTAFDRAGCTAMLTIYKNRDGYTRDNVAICGDRIVTYDKRRVAAGLAGVDIGYGIFDRSVLDCIPDCGNPSFEGSVYPQLVAGGTLAAFETDQRYYSIGSPERLPLTRTFLRREKMVLLDRDGTLNLRRPPGEYVTSWEQWTWAPGALQGLAQLRSSGYRLAVITNQPGVARGSLSLTKLEEIHDRMCVEADAAGGRLDAVFVCTHGWDDGCECRKPQPGLLIEAQRQFALDLSQTPFIGDDDRDALAAARAGTPFYRVSESHSVADVAQALCTGESSFASAF